MISMKVLSQFYKNSKRSIRIACFTQLLFISLCNVIWRARNYRHKTRNIHATIAIPKQLFYLTDHLHPLFKKMPSLRLGNIAPDFEADTTAGRIRFHEWIDDSWVLTSLSLCVLSHLIETVS